MPTMLVALPGSCVGCGDYLRMAEAIAALCPEVVLLNSMGNDLYGNQAIGYAPIAQGLLLVRTRVPKFVVVYGGLAAIWRYDDDGYDVSAQRVCEDISGEDGGAELSCVTTIDAIGHLVVPSMPQLCNALVTWAMRATCDKRGTAHL